MSQVAAPRGAMLAPPAQPLPASFGGFSSHGLSWKWAALTQGFGAIDTLTAARRRKNHFFLNVQKEPLCSIFGFRKQLRSEMLLVNIGPAEGSADVLLLLLPPLQDRARHRNGMSASHSVSPQLLLGDAQYQQDGPSLPGHPELTAPG